MDTCAHPEVLHPRVQAGGALLHLWFAGRGWNNPSCSPAATAAVKVTLYLLPACTWWGGGRGSILKLNPHQWGRGLKYWPVVMHHVYNSAHLQPPSVHLLSVVDLAARHLHHEEQFSELGRLATMTAYPQPL